MMEWIRFILGALLMTAGLAVFGLSVFGVYRFRFVLNRMHAAAMGDTLGLLFMLLGLIVFAGFSFPSLKLLLIIVMLWLTSPVASHLIARLEIKVNEQLSDHVKEVRHE